MTKLLNLKLLGLLFLPVCVVIYFAFQNFVEAQDNRIIIDRLNNQTLEIKTENDTIQTESWRYLVLDSDQQACDDSQQSRFETLDNALVTRLTGLAEADYDKIYCFRVFETAQNQFIYKTYYLFGLDHAPQIDLTLDATAGSILASLANQMDIKPETWQYQRFISDVTCDHTVDFTQFLAQDLTVAVNHQDNGSWYCFKVKSVNDVTGYQKIQVQGLEEPEVIVIESPSFRVKLDGQTLRLESSGALRDVSYTILTSGETCGQPAFQTGVVVAETVVLDETNRQATFCFRAKGASEAYGYSSFDAGNPAYQQPTISLDQAGSAITFQSDIPVAHWYYTVKQNDRCSHQDNFDKMPEPEETTVSLTYQDNLKYFCFQAQTEAGASGYQNILVNYTRPVLELSQEGKAIKIKADREISQYSYVKSPETITCNEETNFSDFFDYNLFDPDQPEILDSADNGHYFCFKGEDAHGSFGYALLKVEDVPVPAAVETEDNNLFILIFGTVCLLIGVLGIRYSQELSRKKNAKYHKRVDQPLDYLK